MKRLIGVAVAVALCGFVFGCQKKAGPEAEKGMEAKPAPMAAPAVPPPPPPPPPPAPAPEQGGGQ